MSNDAYTAAARRLGRGVLTVVPLTSNVKRVLSFQVLVSKRGSGLAVDSKAQAEQVRAVDMGRLVNRVGKLSTEEGRRSTTPCGCTWVSPGPLDLNRR